jgi:hypothetical protein
VLRVIEQPLVVDPGDGADDGFVAVERRDVIADRV